jgi:hypothetical protein
LGTTKKKIVIQRLARWLWRRDADQGQMVGSEGENQRYWNSEARKILKIVRKGEKE